MYSGFKTLDNACKGAPHLMKPASHEQLLNAVEGLIRNARGAVIAREIIHLDHSHSDKGNGRKSLAAAAPDIFVCVRR